MSALKKSKMKLNRRRGSVTVLALMVSLMIMILITATMTMTIINNDVMGDYARNKKTIQAADSGIQNGRLTLARALTGWQMPAGAQKTQIDSYVTDANSGTRVNDRDISLLKDAGLNFADIIPRNTTVATANLDSDGVAVDYRTSIDIAPTSVTLPAANDITYKHTFHYNYFINSEGDANVGGQHNQATRVQRGSFSIDVQRPSFSTYGYFTENMKNNLGAQLWFYNGEVYDGPTHVNSATDTSAFYGRPIFKGAFTSVQGAAGNTYQNSGALLAGGANPDFQAGQSWGVEKITTPSNGWSQLRAAIGDYNGAAAATQPTNSEMRNLLGLSPGNGAVPQGVYYAPNNNSSGAANPLGGILINGDAQEVKFTTSGNSQIITVTMNNNDGGPFTGNQTWVFNDNKQTGTLSVTRNGSPAGTWNSNLNGVIHTAGKVNSLKGDGTLNGADIQTDQQITLSVDGDIKVNDHLTYQTDPRVTPTAKNVLGLYSSGGNVMLGSSAPSGLTMNATVMAIAAGKGVGAEGLVVGSGYNKGYGNKGNWNLLGGLIENTNQTTGVIYSDGTQAGYTWNFSYDQRFKSGVAPPYFPYVTKFNATLGPIQDTALGRKYY